MSIYTEMLTFAARRIIDIGCRPPELSQVDVQLTGDVKDNQVRLVYYCGEDAACAWAFYTPQEARDLAADLIAGADRLDREALDEMHTGG